MAAPGLGTPVVAVGVRCPLGVVVAGGEMVQSEGKGKRRLELT